MDAFLPKFKIFKIQFEFKFFQGRKNSFPGLPTVLPASLENLKISEDVPARGD